MESVFAFRLESLEKIIARLRAAERLATAAEAALTDCNSREVETQLLTAIQAWKEAAGEETGNVNTN